MWDLVGNPEDWFSQNEAQIQNAPADRAHDIELDIDLLGFSLQPHLPYSPDLASFTWTFNCRLSNEEA